ncbi:Pesticidal crystal protein cry22Aa [compost metagenome]
MKKSLIYAGFRGGIDYIWPTMKKLAKIIAFTLLSAIYSQAQNYVTVGDSYGIPTITSAVCTSVDSCFTLTDDVTSQAGAVWDLNTIDLSNSFDAVFCLTLGSNDAGGADGFAFVMRGPGSAQFGSVGGGIGYVGITPSLAIEYDTWDNGAPMNDIPEDHTGLYQNGNQLAPLVSSVPLSVSGANVEDGTFHQTRVVWNASDHKLEMYFDGALRLSHTEDFVNTIFGGNPNVIWGFTASTGGSTNLQQICFPQTSLELDDISFCEGDTTNFLSFYTDNLTSYRWIAPDGDTLVNWNTIDFSTPFNLDDTLVWVNQAGVYTLEVSFNNNDLSATSTITIIPNPVINYHGQAIHYCPDTASLVLMGSTDLAVSSFWTPPMVTQPTYPIPNELSAQGWYHVEMVEPILGCTSKDSVYIEMYCDPIVTVPNIFTPNNDPGNNNEVFNLIMPSKKWVKVQQFTIVNRWGNPVYFVDHDYPNWDGRVDGKPAVEGVYFYTLIYSNVLETESFSKQGFLHLFR